MTDKQKQTAINLAIVAAAFAESTKVINELTNIPNAVSLHCCHQSLCHQIWYVIMTFALLFQTVEDLITVLEDLQKWNVDVLRTNISK